jgi:hypothetical protein
MKTKTKPKAVMVEERPETEVVLEGGLVLWLRDYAQDGKSLLAQADVGFGEECGAAGGLIIRGFAVWRTAAGKLAVTVPARKGGRGYIPYLSVIEGAPNIVRRIQEEIAQAYMDWRTPSPKKGKKGSKAR